MLRTLVCTAMLSVVAMAPAYAAENGEPAPAFEVKDIDGKAQSLEQYKGKVVVLEWHNPGCPFVKKHYESGNMQALQTYALDKGVVWLSINSGGPGKEGALDVAGAKEMIEKSKAHETAYILDPEGKLGKLYSAKTTPHMFVVDKEGKLAYQGAIDDKPTADAADVKGASNYVRNAIDSLLEGKPIVMAQTRAYGCSVKYAN